MVSHLTGQRAAVLMAAVALMVVLLCPTGSVAQAPAITPDGTLGTVVGRLGDAYSVDAGTIRGTNLFHSFGLFNVPTGGSATFLGPNSIANILSRVTGGQQSTIDGLITTRASMPTANFFFINPSGVVFTSGASLDVGGAFRVSTADNIRLADGAVFSATPVPGELGLLTSAPPQAFGFLGNNPAAISVQGVALAVDPGQTLSLVGGDVQIIEGAALIAPGGVVQIGSVASAGEAVLGAPGLDLVSFSSLGQVTISGGGGISAGTDGILPGGTVIIRGGQLIVDNAVIVNDTGDLAGAPVVGIDLRATDSIVLQNSALVQTTSGAGNASGISIATGGLAVTDAAIESLAVAGRTGAIDVQVGSADILNGVIRTSSVASGGGNITIAASAGTVTLSGPTSVISTGTFALDPNILAGNISLSAGNVILNDRAKISSGGAGAEPGESLRITATDSVTISGLAGIESQAFSQNAGTVEIAAQSLAMDAGFINTSTLGAGNAGPILVNANTVTLTNGAQIASSSQIVAPGAGGNITISAPGAVTISGVGPDDGVGSITFTGDPSSGIFSTASGTGNAGQIAVSTPTLTVADGGKISVATEGAGSAGSILASVSKFSLTGGAQVVSSTTGDGAGGTVGVTAGELVFVSGTGSGLFSTAESTGSAGQIAVTTPALTIGDNGKISVETSFKESGAGSAGSVSLNTNTFSLTGGAQVVSSTSGVGAGGTLGLTASELVSISGTGSGLFSTASGTGNAGQITVSAPALAPVPSLTMADGGTISVATSGAGSAGSILLNANTFSLAGGAQVLSSTSNIGNAGSISLNVSEFTQTGGSRVESSTSGAGAGGTLGLTASELVSISGTGSGLFSTASSTGNAGQITVSAPALAPVPTLTVADNGKISVETSLKEPGAGSAGSILLNANTFSLTGGAQVVSSTSGSGQGGSVMATATESMSIAGSGTLPSGLFSTASSTGNAGQITVSAPALAPVPTLTMADGGTISVATSGAGSAGSILLNANTFSLAGGAQVLSSTSNIGNAGSISLNVSEFTQTGGSRVESSTSGAGAGGTLGLTASELVSISGTGSGLFSTASSTGNAGQITVAAPGSTPVPTLTVADNGKISVETSLKESGAGSAGSIFLNANNFSLTGGAQVESSTSGFGQGGSVTVTATESMSISGSGSLPSGLFSTASSTGNAGQITVSAPALAPVPTLTMANGGTISVATSGAGSAGSILLNANTFSLAGGAQVLSSTSNIGNAGSISLNVGNFTQAGGSRVESSTSGAGAGGTLGLTASELVSISGTGSGLFSTASSTGNAGQITVSAPALAPVPTLTVGDNGKISVETSLKESGAGSAGSIFLNANNFSLTGGAQVESSTSGFGQGGSVTVTATESMSISGSGSLPSGLFSTASSTGNAGQITVSAPALAPVPTLTMANGGTISVATSGAGSAGSILLNANTLSLAGGAQVVSSTSDVGNAGSISLNVGNFTQAGGSRVESSTSGAGAGGTLGLTASELVSISGTGSGLFSTASSTGNAGQITVAAPGSTPVPTLTVADNGKISVETSLKESGAGSAGSIFLNANNFSLTGGAQVESSTSGFGQGGSVTVTATESMSISGSGSLPSGLFSTASSTGNAGQITVSAPALAPVPTLTMANGGTISVATSGAGSAGSILLNANTFSLAGGAQVLSSTSNIGNAGSISLNVGNFTQAGGSRVESSTSGAGAGGTLGLTASELVSISGTGSGLFSTASSTGNAGQITVSAPALAPVPTLTVADNGKISVETSFKEPGAGSAGSILLNANTFSLAGGAQVVSSTSGAGAGGTLGLTASELVSISGTGSGLFSTASSTGNAGQITVSAPALTPVPTLTMADGGKISVATEGSGSAGNIALNVSNFTQTGGAQVVSSTTGDGAGGTLALTAGEMVSISGAGSGLFSTASSTGNAGQITVSAPALAPVPTLTMADGGKISVETSGAGSAGSILLNANTLNLTGGAQVVSSTTGAGEGGNLAVTATNSMSISGSGSLASGLFSTASNTGDAGEVTVSTPTLAMSSGGTISVATSGAGNAGNALLNVSNFSLTGGAQVVSSTSGAGQGGSVSANATDSISISGQATGMFSNASGTGAGGTINLQAAQLQITDAGAVSANSTGTATATAGNVNIVAGELVQMQNGSITTESTLADGGNISITTTGSMVRLNDSQITTSVRSGAGSGGNITIGSEFVLLNNTEIRADAFGGPGGNITIVADTFLRSNSIVSASSALSTPGTIAIEATFTDVTGSFAQLPSTPLEATELLRASCAARLAGGKASSLVVGGRDGVPLQPGSLLPSPLYVSDPSIAPKSITQEMPLRFTLLGSKDRLSNQYSLLPNAKCSL